jgi:hypothetical protein
MGIVAFIGWAMLIGLIVRRRYTGNPTALTLLQYQGGVLYKRGLPVREVHAGKHRVWVPMEKIMILDKRPNMVSFENRAVSLTDGATALYGFSASAEIQELSKALYSARNYNEVPAYVFLCCTRSVLNNCASGNLLSRQDSLTTEIASKAKARLAVAGFEFQSFRFTHLSIAAPPATPISPGPANPQVH